jgi:hypothetical protein
MGGGAYGKELIMSFQNMSENTAIFLPIEK